MTLDYTKHPDGLVPAIVQDANTKQVLMLGYMNADAVAKTKDSKQVTFFSRSKNRLWTKGEESGHVLELVSMAVDCDSDTLLANLLYESKMKSKPPPSLRFVGKKSDCPSSSYFSFGPILEILNPPRQTPDSRRDNSRCCSPISRG